MQLSSWGSQMSVKSGIGSIMDDIGICASATIDDPWLNLSPGNPAPIPEAMAFWQGLAEEALAEDFAEAAGRCGPARGTHGLVAALVDYLRGTLNWPVEPGNIVVGPGAQLLTFMAVTSFSDRRRPLVLPRLPDYAGYQGLGGTPSSVVGVAPRVVIDDDRRFHYALDLAGVRAQPSIGMLLLSNPANPTGSSLVPEELDSLVSLAQERDLPLLVDNAYGEPFPGVTETMTAPIWHPNVINCFTLSKAGLPGERIGFLVGATEAIAPMVGFMANTMLHTAQLIQSAARRAFATRQIDALTEKVIRPYYEAKRIAVEQVLYEQLPQDIAWRMHANRGGMFCWLWIDEPWFDDLSAYLALKRQKVLIVPGRHFFTRSGASPQTDNHARRCVRLSLSGELAVISEGISRLSAVLEDLRRTAAAR